MWCKCYLVLEIDFVYLKCSHFRLAVLSASLHMYYFTVGGENVTLILQMFTRVVRKYCDRGTVGRVQMPAGVIISGVKL